MTNLRYGEVRTSQVYGERRFVVPMYHAREGVMTATFPVAGPAPRLAELVESLPAVDGLPVNKVSYSEEITNLPAPHKGVLLIVSRITAAAVTGREDILFPHGEVRDENGRILGVRALGRF